ncbi:MAG TPA: response regulator transcription factor [Solirubrobacterales bacterium]|jgi:DNA-binding NarL/FixJ family response regulator|nr:response regulator transcription factor [Solirubrobacterales bacterium]
MGKSARPSRGGRRAGETASAASTSEGGKSSPVGIRVLIVGDHELFRRGLGDHLEASGLEVVDEADDVEDAVILALEAEPDVVVMDIRLNGAPSIDAIRRLRAEAPGAQVLVLTDSVQEDVVAALSAGACGVLLKDEEGDQVVTAIAAAAAGESPLSPPIASALVSWVREHEPRPARSDAPVLTAREREVLDLIVAGRDNSEIAAELVISPETVKTHVSAILEKLHVENRVQAAVAAVSAGLVTFVG